MGRLKLLWICFLLLGGLIACNRKSHPEVSKQTPGNTPVVVKPARKPPAKTAIPKVITVSNGAARKSVDGRYYYDLEGHRYWRNNRDGKYYLFHKSMFDDPDFNAPGN